MLTPLSQMLYLLSVGCFLVVCYESNYGGVVRKFDNGIGGVNLGAVVHEKGVEEGAEDAFLWRSCVQDQS